GGGMTVTVVFELTRDEGSYTVEFDGLTGSFTVKPSPTPAEFIVSGLKVDPEIKYGEEVTITVEVENIGEQEGTHTVQLDIEDLITEPVEVTLEGGESTTVTFTIIIEVAGEHTVSVEDQTMKFIVSGPPFWMVPGYVAGIIIVIIAAVVLVYAIRKGMIPSLSPEIDDEI
ncbi:unnamed protein product, partial [marine sediment metagenome]